MTLTYEVQEDGERKDVSLPPACWGHCCIHSGYGHDEW